MHCSICSARCRHQSGFTVTPMKAMRVPDSQSGRGSPSSLRRVPTLLGLREGGLRRSKARQEHPANSLRSLGFLQLAHTIADASNEDDFSGVWGSGSKGPIAVNCTNRQLALTTLCAIEAR
jgi:hypothetical protein